MSDDGTKRRNERVLLAVADLLHRRASHGRPYTGKIVLNVKDSEVRSAKKEETLESRDLLGEAEEPDLRAG